MNLLCYNYNLQKLNVNLLMIKEGDHFKEYLNYHNISIIKMILLYEKKYIEENCKIFFR